MSVRTAPWPLAAVALTAVVALAGLVAPGPAAAPASAAAPTRAGCPSGPLSVRILQTGCATSSGTVRVPDGRTFTVPAPGESVVATSIAVPGAEELPDVAVANTGRSGVAVQVDGVWSGAPAAVRHERSRQDLVASSAASVLPRAAASAKCTSTANTQNAYRWTSAVRWYYNPTGQKATYGQQALRAAAAAWTGKITACGQTRTSTAGQTYLRTAKQAPGLTAQGGCASSNGYSVTGWGALPVGTLGVTCVWYDQDGVAKEADQRYSTRYSWGSTATCSGSRYDTQAVATHEWGHLYGLGHVASSTGQVMRPSGGYCDLASRTLGRGDLTGIVAKY